MLEFLKDIRILNLLESIGILLIVSTILLIFMDDEDKEQDW